MTPGMKALMLFVLGSIILRVSTIIAYRLFGLTVSDLIKEILGRKES